MRNNDPRSRCMAILPDMFVNGHLLAQGDPWREPLLRAFALLENAGFGMVQLPPDDLSLEPARTSLDFALDQIADYLKHGYRFLLVELGPPPVWRPYLDAEIRRRAVAGIEGFRLQPDEAGLQAFEERLAAIRQAARVAAGG
ncbi:hypothetical protein [Hypericibacter sp.]|uniref:hypothetical protein n=1 Tax=Hypericibacter sp. TaxID=2705401 RepID=UPI003D6D8BD4